MTEQEWLKCTSPEEMLDYLEDRAGKRKYLLFASACERRLWDRPDCERDKVVATEQYADGEEHAAHAVIIPTEGITLAAYITSVSPLEFASGESSYVAEYAAHLAAEQWSGSRDGRHERAWRPALAAEKAEQCALLRDIFGNPFRPALLDPRWQTAAVVAMARTIYEERKWDELPVLADALEEAGCAVPAVLSHCRGGGEHVRGCWVVDLVLGKK
jgi:hypothetical protein